MFVVSASSPLLLLILSANLTRGMVALELDVSLVVSVTGWRIRLGVISYMECLN